MAPRNSVARRPAAAKIEPPRALSRGALQEQRTALVDQHASLDGALKQLQAQANEVVGRMNQVAGGVATIDRILASLPEDVA